MNQSKNLSWILLGLSLWACQQTQNAAHQQTEKTSPKTETKPAENKIPTRAILSSEKPFVGSWRTVFKDVQGKLYERRNYVGNFLQFKEDGTYQLFRDSVMIRSGAWEFQEKTKQLQMTTRKNDMSYTVTTLLPNMLEMTDNKHQFKLVYVPYQL
jgi:hypothetical protein